MKTINNLRRILLICRWITSNVIVMLPPLWVSAINNKFLPPDHATFQTIFEFACLQSLAIGLTCAQGFTASRFDEFVITSFRHAYPRYKLYFPSQVTHLALVAAFAGVLVIFLIPDIQFYYIATCIIITVLDLVALATMLGLSLYWRRCPADYSVVDPDSIETGDVKAADIIIGEPVKIEIDLDKIIGDTFVPVGIIFRIDAETGKIRSGVVAANSCTGEKKIVFDDGSTADVNDGITELSP